jgi:hypothetical protein
MLQIADIAYLSAPLNSFRIAHANCVRKSVSESFVSLSESLRVIRYIRSQFDPDERDLRKSVLLRYKLWQMLTTHGRAPWELQKKLAMEFEETIPGAGMKIYKDIPFLYGKKLWKSLIKSSGDLFNN